MNKKILYGFILLSLFLLSAISTVRPAYGYTFGVPKQAIGMTAEGEVKIYDKKEWAKHFGEEGDRPDDIWDGDSDVVGAKSKGKVLEMETDEKLIHYFWDFVLETDLTFNSPVTGQPVESVSVYKDAINFINDTIAGDLASGLGLVVSVCDYITNNLLQGNATVTALRNAAFTAYVSFLAGTPTKDVLQTKYDTKYDGTIVTQDSWDYYKDADYPAKPDEKKKEGPFLADPRDWKDSYDTLFEMKHELYYQLMGPNLDGAGGYSLVGVTAYTTYATLAATQPVIIANIDALVQSMSGGLADLLTVFGGAAQGPSTIYNAFEELIPKKAGFLYMQLESGMPCYVPTDDFLAKAVKEYNIEDDDKETGHPALNGAIPFTCEVSVEGMVVTMEFEFDDVRDPDSTDPDDTIKDWTVVFTYGEYGTQSKAQYMSGSKIFYEKGGVEQIPGYEVYIILGASALSIIGLVYVIMKKRKI